MAPRTVRASLLVFTLLFTYATCVNEHPGKQHVFSDSSGKKVPHFGISLVRKGYLKRTNCYYPNSTATFHLPILCCGDVETNPCPVNSDNDCDHQRSSTRLPRSVSCIICAVIYYPQPDNMVAERLITHIQTATDSLKTAHPDAGFILMGDFNKLEYKCPY